MAGPTTYQRVSTATDYDSMGFPHYLAFDGVDDSLSTGSIDFTNTDKMTIVAGIRHLVDTPGLPVELSANTNSNPGTFYISTGADGVTGINSSSRGTATISINQQAGLTIAAPVTSVVTVTHDIAGDLSRVARNGVYGTNATGDKGAGNFGNYPIYIGCRGGTSFPFNGHLYQLVVRGAATADLTPGESHAATKTGISL